MRIRFRQIDVPHGTVHGPDGLRGFPLPDEDDSFVWEPFQVEIRAVPRLSGDDEKRRTHVRLAVWERLVE